MSSLGKNHKLVLPDRMKGKLESFQKKVWMVKAAEGLLAGCFGLLISFLVTFVLDRFIDTPSALRLAILVTGCVGLGIWFPLVCHKWIWRSRRLEQVARLLRYKFPRLGDHLLGIIELVNNPDHRGQSEQLCAAALRQVDQETKDQDFSSAVPNSKHRSWFLATVVPAALVLVAIFLVPAASQNAFARWITPWLEIQRYTFAQVKSIPDTIVVPEVEPANLDVALASRSPWRPANGVASIGSSVDRPALQDDVYRFNIPPQQKNGDLQLTIGDYKKTVSVEPKPRPELKSIEALVTLPEYLQRTEPVTKDARSGSIDIVQGAQFHFNATATRALKSATVNRTDLEVTGSSLQTEPFQLTESQDLHFHWVDQFGLTPLKPLTVNARISVDKKPTIDWAEQKSTRSVYNGKRYVLESDLLVFDVHCEDDFGVKTVGLQWEAQKPGQEEDSKEAGDILVAAGNPEATQMNVKATFSPSRMGLKSTQVFIKIYTVDYRPGRERVYGQTVPVYVLSQQEHAILLTKKLDHWFKQSLETYEREQQLFQENVRLRNLSTEELDRPKIRKKIEAQAAAERSQAARLSQLARVGDQLAAEAARNDQFNVGTLEKLAEMLQTLKGISGKRMPSVSDLLKTAANAKAGSPSSGNQKLSVGNNKGKPESGKSGASSPSKTPSIVLTESSLDQNKKGEDSKESKEEAAKKSGGKFTLPTVNLKDNSPMSKSGSCPAQDKMEEAVLAQQELLAEFQKVAEELQKILNNLEGSTFVKRLKALSRHQIAMAKDINGVAVANFGGTEKLIGGSARKRYKMLAKREKGYEKTINHIEEDLEAYANRVSDGKFKGVLNELKAEEVSKQIQDISATIVRNNSGSSIAHSEYLADTFDRWAEQLVGPG